MTWKGKNAKIAGGNQEYTEGPFTWPNLWQLPLVALATE